MTLGVGNIGDAGCPSLQQLMGIVDSSDPCQSVASPDITGNITPDPFGATYCLSGPGPLSPGQIYCPGVLDTYQNSSQEFFASQSSGLPWWLIPVGVLVVFAAMGAGRR